MQIQEVVARAQEDTSLMHKLETEPVKTLETLASGAPAPLATDVWIYRVVVGSLGLIALIAMVGGLVLAVYDKTMPEGGISLGSMALGAIAGLLAPSPARGR